MDMTVCKKSKMEAILGDDCPYGVLGLPSRGTAQNKKLRPEDITRAYHKMALQYHPDRNATPEATPMFQKVSAAYHVLGTVEGRRQYDKDGTGSTTCSEDWTEAFRTLFKAPDEKAVADFYATYIGTEEERADIVKYYNDTKGDFGRMMEYCMHPNEVGHVPRIKAIVLDLIEKGSLTACKKFTVTSAPAKVRALEENLEEELKACMAERRKSGKGKSASDDLQLQLALRHNAQKFDDVLDRLESKYAETENKPKRQKKSK